MRTQWEYLTLKVSAIQGFFSGTDFDKNDFQKDLNAKGRDGWELVSLCTIERAAGKGGTECVVAVMKRPRETSS